MADNRVQNVAHRRGAPSPSPKDLPRLVCIKQGMPDQRTKGERIEANDFMRIGLQAQGRPHKVNHGRIQPVHHDAVGPTTQILRAPSRNLTMRRERTGPMPGKSAHSSALARLMSNCRVLNTDSRRESVLGCWEHLPPLGSFLLCRFAASRRMVRVHVLQPATERCHGGLRNVPSTSFPRLGSAKGDCKPIPQSTNMPNSSREVGHV